MICGLISLFGLIAVGVLFFGSIIIGNKYYNYSKEYQQLGIWILSVIGGGTILYWIIEGLNKQFYCF